MSNSEKHEWELVTKKSDKSGTYDVYRCKRCADEYHEGWGGPSGHQSAIILKHPNNQTCPGVAGVQFGEFNYWR